MTYQYGPILAKLANPEEHPLLSGKILSVIPSRFLGVDDESPMRTVS
jgi:hypothetical protein